MSIATDMIDLSPLVPPNLEAEVINDRLTLRTKNVRGPNASAIVKRYVSPAEFCYFLGLLRSEGGNKRPNSRQISFVNMDVRLHSEFIRIAKIVGANSFKAYLYHSEKATPNEVYGLAKSFEEATGVKISKIRPANQKARITLMTYINNAAITRLLLHGELVLRKMMSNSDLDPERAFSYLRGVTDGDGSVQLNIREDLKGGYLGPRLHIAEGDVDAAWDIWRIMRRLGFTCYLRKQRAYALTAKLTLSQTLKLLKHRFFRYSPHNYVKLLCHVELTKLKEKRVWKLFNAFKTDEFTAREATKVFNVKSPDKARASLNYFTSLGLLNYSRGKNHLKKFKLNERGLPQAKLIDEALDELKRTKLKLGVMDIKEILLRSRTRHKIVNHSLISTALTSPRALSEPSRPSSPLQDPSTCARSPRTPRTHPA